MKHHLNYSNSFGYCNHNPKANQTLQATHSGCAPVRG
jgi:hypothetical protein